MNIVVAGTGYVGLVTGVVLSEIGHNVICVDLDERKIEKMRQGKSPIFESGLEDLMKKNAERIEYTTDYKNAYKCADVIYIGVGTPERADGSANLDYVYSVCNQIVESVEKDCIIVVKSTVPIGTNDKLEKFFKEKVASNIEIDVVSNPEFLSQGTAVHDTLYASRIVIGVENKNAEKVMKELYKPLTKPPYKQPLLIMNRKSAEMVKYASNDFLALKISYVNEIANFCSSVGANIEDVANGMGLDPRIGNKFLNPGIGYGGSCFPKDTKALHSASKQLGSELLTVKAAIEVNKRQKVHLLEKALQYFSSSFKGMTIACLGVTFKPGTDDLREAASLDNVKLLLEYGANVRVYDPIGLDNFRKVFNSSITYCCNIEDTILDADCCFIFTEWDDIITFKLENYEKCMKTPIIFDGRNCYSVKNMEQQNIFYYSIGRKIANEEMLKEPFLKEA